MRGGPTGHPEAAGALPAPTPPGPAAYPRLLPAVHHAVVLAGHSPPGGQLPGPLLLVAPLCKAGGHRASALQAPEARGHLGTRTHPSSPAPGPVLIPREFCPGRGGAVSPHCGVTQDPRGATTLSALPAAGPSSRAQGAVRMDGTGWTAGVLCQQNQARSLLCPWPMLLILEMSVRNLSP